MLQASYLLGLEKARGELRQAEAGIEEVNLSITDFIQSIILALFQIEQNIRGLREVEALQKEQLSNAREN